MIKGETFVYGDGKSFHGIVGFDEIKGRCVETQKGGLIALVWCCGVDGVE